MVVTPTVKEPPLTPSARQEAEDDAFSDFALGKIHELDPWAANILQYLWDMQDDQLTKELRRQFDESHRSPE